MGEQFAGGGVIIIVAVLLWALYLLPTVQRRMRYNATERNAVRLNQALRVLVESAEAPEEVEVELNVRGARERQRQARLAHEERLRAERDLIRLEAEAERERARQEVALERDRLRLLAERDAQRLARERALLGLDASVRRRRAARARRIVRLVATLLLAAAVVSAAIGTALVVAGGAPWMLLGGIVAAFVSLHLLGAVARAAKSARRVAPAVADVAPAPRQRQASALLDPEDRGWTPRPLPTPLSSVAGSATARALDGVEAREALRVAAREEALRAAAESIAPPAPVPLVRRDEEPPAAADGDEAIEAHVRRMLQQRAVG